MGKKPRPWWEALPKADQRRLKRAFQALRRRGSVFASRREAVRWLRPLLSRCKRAYVKYHHDEALDDAVRICADYGLPQERWMAEALARSKTAEILGHKKKNKSGPKSDLMRDHILFEAIQERLDAGMPLYTEIRPRRINTALGQVQAEEAYYGRRITYDGLRKVYRRHRPLVRRAPDGWVFRAGVYVPKLSVGLPA